MCSEWRQEFILLSDVLGVSMLVDSSIAAAPAARPRNTILGPFYVEKRPMRANGDSICEDGKGEPCLVEGAVRGVDGEPVAGAVVDVWQTNDDGFYDVQQKGAQPEGNMRGAFTTDADGRYSFRTARPGITPFRRTDLSASFSGNWGATPTAQPTSTPSSSCGLCTVITHIFEPGCRYLREDAVFGVKQSLIGEFVKVDDRDAARRLGFGDVPFFWRVQADFTLAPASGRQAFVHQV